MNRRRVLTVVAACLLVAPARATPTAVWTGRAMGAEARIVLRGADRVRSRRVFARVEAELRRVESHFSLHADSALARLNRDGRLARPAPEIRAVFDLAGRVWQATGGVFDPSIQPLWLATATGGDTDAARALVGWDGVRIGADEIALAPGMALTFNGIAQGHAADRIAEMLRAEGFGDVLIDIGEVMALGRNARGAWQAAIAAPDGAELARVGLEDRALATSSPAATRIGAGMPHILHPAGLPPRWATVAVSAPDAATADALSTAFCLMDADAIGRALGRFPAARIEAITDDHGRAIDFG
ncbi:MAG: FAD:protein FMN transferase [Albidovulum sp.]|jgi:thiamine biosynthesis lipoprotein|uniref:FAD:protein FMN transferase n=1 Tax=Albidovulum sp. TaxID=1872424 RepID=UPI0030589F22